MGPGAVALTQCGLVPALLNLLRPIDKSAAVGYCARRNYILGLNTFREVNGAGVIVQRLHQDIVPLHASPDGTGISGDGDSMAVDPPTGSPSTARGGPSEVEESKGTGGDDADTAPPSLKLVSPTPSVKVFIYSLLSLLSLAFQSQGGTHIHGASEGSQHLRTPMLTEALIDPHQQRAHLQRPHHLARRAALLGHHLHGPVGGVVRALVGAGQGVPADTVIIRHPRAAALQRSDPRAAEHPGQPGHQQRRARGRAGGQPLRPPPARLPRARVRDAGLCRRRRPTWWEAASRTSSAATPRSGPAPVVGELIGVLRKIVAIGMRVKGA
jgi:hypothetical protein